MYSKWEPKYNKEGGLGSGAVGTDRYISLRNVSSVAFEMFTTRKLKDITDKECHKTF